MSIAKSSIKTCGSSARDPPKANMLHVADARKTESCSMALRPVEGGEWEDTLHSLFLSISYEPKSPFKLWRADRVLTREAFFEMIPNLPGVLSDQLFSAFDLDNSGTIDFNEFLEGLHALGETTEKKLNFLHRMYDLNGDGLVSKQELLMMLTHMNGSQDQQQSYNDIMITHPVLSSESGAESTTTATTYPCIENLIQNILPDDSSALDFPSFAKLLQSEPHLRRILENFCLNTMPKFLPFYFNGRSTLTPAASSVHDNSSTLSGVSRTYIKLLVPSESISALTRPYEFCGWLSLKRHIHFGVLKDKYLLLYKSPFECVPTKAICLIGARCDAHNMLGRLLRSRTESNDDQIDLLRIDQSYLDDPGQPFQYIFSFTLTLARGRQKITLGTRSARDRLRWRRAIRDILTRKLSEFHEHYLLRGALGQGRFSTVFAAQHRKTGQKVAVKIMRRPNKTRSTSDEAVAVDSRSKLCLGPNRANCLNQTACARARAFMRRIFTGVSIPDANANDLRDLQRTEVSVLRLLNHANLVKLIDVYYSADYIYIIMPWSPAGDLRGLLDALLTVNRYLLSTFNQRQEQNSRNYPDISSVKFIWIPDLVCQTLLRGILRGLSYVHSKLRNVVHRDIKPDNILLDLQIDDLINDVIKSAEGKKRQRALAEIKVPVLPKICISTMQDDSNHRVGSTGVPSMTSRQPDACRPAVEYLAVEASDMSSAVDTIDQYPLDTPRPLESSAHLDARVPTSYLLGALENDQILQTIERPTGEHEEHLNAWLFLHVLLWMFKDRRQTDFLEMLNQGHGAGLPVNLFDQLSTEDLINLITKHTHPRITDFGLSKILAPLEPNTPHSKSPSGATGRLSTHAMEPMGTEAYAAPEVRSGLGYTTSADIWSLGVVAYQTMSNGYFPSIDGRAQCPGATTFAGLPCAHMTEISLHFVPEGLWHGVPDLAKSFIKSVLQVDADKRPTAEECLEHLWLNQQPQTSG